MTYEIKPPMALLAEVTHRCPLQCPYCSNPVELVKADREIDTETWCRVITEAKKLGILQIHFSGGEPLLRKDLEQMIAHARQSNLYSNLITSGISLTESRLDALKQAGIDHIQLSFQDSDEVGNDTIGGLRDSFQRKRQVAEWVRKARLPLTVNLVVHRQNLQHLDEMLQMAESLKAQRVEIANVQYYGWAYHNRTALMPTREQLETCVETIDAARERLKGIMVIDFVVPDYYAKRPKACMGGWGNRFLNVTPEGKVLPCHAAETITTLKFDSVVDQSLSNIWQNSEAFNRYRGTDWMPDPCRSCSRREIDWGGCRCQAFAIAGDAGIVDPACELSEQHEELVSIAESESASDDPRYIYRNFKNIEIVKA